jgi:hypothetical protein
LKWCQAVQNRGLQTTVNGRPLQRGGSVGTVPR